MTSLSFALMGDILKFATFCSATFCHFVHFNPDFKKWTKWHLASGNKWAASNHTTIIHVTPDKAMCLETLKSSNRTNAVNHDLLKTNI